MIYPTLASGTIWHWLFSAIVAGAVLVLCAGCMPSAAEIQAIGKDHSTLDIDIVIDARPWFQNTMHVHRANPFLFPPTTQPTKP